MDEEHDNPFAAMLSEIDRKRRQEIERQETDRELRNVELATLNTPEELRARFTELMKPHGLEPGCLCRWKPGLCNRTIQCLMVVVELVPRDKAYRADPAHHEGCSPYAPGFHEILDCRVGVIRDSGRDFDTWWLDSQRLMRV